MTDLLEERLRAAADREMADVKLAAPEMGAASRAGHHRWITGGAALAAAAVLGLVVWAAALKDPAPTEPVQPSPAASAQERARSAVNATLAAPQLRADVSGGVNASRWWFVAPDRFESVDGAGDEQVRAVRIGDELYSTDDGGWVRTTVDGDASAPAQLSLLDGLLADGPCFADEGDLLVAWQDPETGCGSSTTSLPNDLPPGSDIWVMTVDADGRVAELAFGEVPGQVGSQRQQTPLLPAVTDETERPIQRAGAPSAFVYRFAYDQVPPITAPEEFTTTTRAADDLGGFCASIAVLDETDGTTDASVVLAAIDDLRNTSPDEIRADIDLVSDTLIVNNYPDRADPSMEAAPFDELDSARARLASYVAANCESDS